MGVLVLAKTDCRGCGRDIISCQGIESCEKCGTVYAGTRSTKVQRRAAAIVRALALQKHCRTTSELVWDIYYILLDVVDEPETARDSMHVFIYEAKEQLKRAGLLISRDGWHGYRIDHVGSG